LASTAQPIMHRIMGYHREPLADCLPDRVGETPPAAAPAHLVLFVGGVRQPERAWLDCLAQRGIRCVWEPDVERLGALQGQVLFDAVIADVSAPGTRMVSMLARARQLHRGRLIVVSNSNDEIDEILALELGADDFLVLPLSPRRLRARLIARLRPGRDTLAPDLPAVPEPRDAGSFAGGWQLDTARLRLRRGDRSVALTASQVQLLQCLGHRVGRLVPRAELHDCSCPGASDIRARTIDVYVHRLRRRLAEEGVTELRIEAVRGRGFVLHAVPAPVPPAPRNHGEAPPAPHLNA
jgi:DNA-binding response OmpR family regulator